MRYLYRFLIILIVLDLIIVVFHYWFGSSIGFFHIEKEQNLSSLYSGFLFIGTAVASFGIVAALLGVQEAFQYRLVALFLGFGMLYMGLDELIVLHERVGFVLNNRFGLTGYRGANFNWVIYYAPAVLASILVFWGMLRMLWAIERRLFVLAGVGIIILFGALGIEVWGGTQILSPMYLTIFVVEEFTEMLGESFLFTAMAGAFFTVFHQHYVRRSV